MKTEDDLRQEIANIIERSLYCDVLGNYKVTNGAIDELIKLIHRQENAAYEAGQNIVTP